MEPSTPNPANIKLISDEPITYEDDTNQVYTDTTFRACHFKGTETSPSQLSRPRLTFRNCVFENCNLTNLSFEGGRCIFDNTHFSGGHLVNCRMITNELPFDLTFDKLVQLEGCLLTGNLSRVRLLACIFHSKSKIDDVTNTGVMKLQNCQFNRNTTIIGKVADPDNADVSSLSELFRAKRKTRWDAWCDRHPRQAFFARAMWCISDYGYSTTRLIACFIGITTLFSQLYILPYWFGKQPLINICIDSPWYTIAAQSLYFSVITTMTVGYGDILPQRESFSAYTLVSVHAVIGCYLWAALIQRITTLAQE